MSEGVVDIERGRQVARIRALEAQLGIHESPLLARRELAGRHGFQFGSKRKLYEALGYPERIELSDYRARYERGDIAKRIVDAKPAATWRQPPEIRATGPKGRGRMFEAQVQELADRLKLWSHLDRVDRLAGIGHYAVLLIGVGKAAPLEREVPRLSGPDDVLFLSPFAEDHAKLEEADADTGSSRFGLPTIYKIDLGGENKLFKGRSLPKPNVHWSRVIHVAEDLGEDDVIGTPRMKAVWNRLHDIDKIVGGAAEMFWRGGFGGQVAKPDEGFTISDTERDDAKNQLDEYEHYLRRVLFLKGISLHPIQTSTADPTGPFRAVISVIAGTTGIPQRVLLGSEQAQLASGQDRANWNERIAERQRSFAEPCLVRGFLDWCIARGAIVDPGSYEVIWEDLNALSENDQAQNQARWAGGLQQIALARSRGTPVPVTDEEIRERAFGLEPELPEALRDPPAPEPEPEPDPNPEDE